MAHSEDHEVTVIPADKNKIRHLWIVAGVLGVVTTIEFIVAFTLHAGVFKTSVFILLTIIKAAYIVGEFMHLKSEAKTLIWSILIPTIFIVWLLITLLYEGFQTTDINFINN